MAATILHSSEGEREKASRRENGREKDTKCIPFGVEKKRGKGIRFIFEKKRKSENQGSQLIVKGTREGQYREGGTERKKNEGLTAQLAQQKKKQSAAHRRKRHLQKKKENRVRLRTPLCNEPKKSLL